MKCKKNDCFSCPYPDCINDYVAPRRERTPEHKEKCAKYQREKYAAAKMQKICVRCYHRQARPGSVMCLECNNQQARLHREKARELGRVSRAEMDGISLCSRCGKRKPLEGHKVCEICYARLLEQLSKVNAQRAERRCSR